MGCLGCELFPEPPEVLEAIDQAISEVGEWKVGQSKKIFARLADEAFRRIKSPEDGHSHAVTTTNIWHLRNVFLQEIHSQQGAEATKRAESAIRQAVTCYAATLHLNKGRNILKPDNGFNKGYAPTFERVTQFEGRVLDMAAKKDLLGKKDPARPWISDLPRLVFVSDMGDAFSRKSDFGFLGQEVIAPIQSEDGKRHLWLWLSKRPDKMAQFGERIGRFPDNVCCMTTVTGPDKLHRVAELRSVPAAVRGLSLEPLWEGLPPEKLDLTGIDWVIIGGESGNPEFVRPFHLEWVDQIQEKCRASGVAFFVKQLGRRPVKKGVPLKLKDPHGGEWDEWVPSLRIREFPQYFYDYRKTAELDAPLSQVEQQDFHRLDGIVSAGMRAGVDAATALFEIRERRLYRAGFATFEEYCQNVHSLTRQYANRLIVAGRVRSEMETIVSKKGLPLPDKESHLRELARVEDPKQRVNLYGEALKEATKGGYHLTAEAIAAKVDESQGEKPVEEDAQKPPSPSLRLKEAVGVLDQLESKLADGGDVRSLLVKLRRLLAGEW